MKTTVSIIPAPQSIKEKKGVLLTGNSFNLRAQGKLASYLTDLSEILKSCGCACTINKKDSSACTVSFSISEEFSKPESYTLNLYIYYEYLSETSQATARPNIQMVFGVFMMIPMFVIYVLFQKQLVAGLTFGAVKE